MLPLPISPNIPRIYTAIAEWLSCMICLRLLRPRISTSKFVFTAVGTLVLQLALFGLTPDLNNVLWLLCMVAALCIMYGFIYLCAEVNVRDAAYYAIRSFIIAEFAASFEWQFELLLLHHDPPITSMAVRILVLVICYGIVFALFDFVYYHYHPKEKDALITTGELISYAFIGLAVFVMSNLGFLVPGLPIYGNYSDQIYNARTLVDLSGVAIMYTYHVQRMNMRIRYELDSVQNLLHNQYAQYKQARDAIEMINYKYHDLKHHIIVLRAEENTKKRNEYLNQMEEDLLNYEAQNKTGNTVIDVVLTMKTMYCQKHGITITSVIDGTLFKFMNAMDISSIFGNALDNAIECETRIADKEKRLIHINAHSRKNFLIILFENYYEGEIKLDTGLPATTKGDSRFHGYGLKSVQYVAQKYGGAVDVSASDHWFHLKILIPIPDSATTVSDNNSGNSSSSADI